jgi:uncharacterized protein
MLIRFRVENHRSIRNEQELSLVASSLSEHTESLVHAERYDFDLLRVAAVYGANASGKSTLLDALGFMKTAVIESHRQWVPDGGIPRTPFAFGDEPVNAPSLFAVDLLLDGIRYEYGFVLDSSRILEEWLYAYPKGRRQEWFTRDAARDQEFAFSRLLQGENRAISNLTRPNSLFLSAAAQNNHPMLAPLYRWFVNEILVLDEKTRAVAEMTVLQFCMHDWIREAVQELLASADLGIASVEMIEEDPSNSVSRSDFRNNDPVLHLLFPRVAAGVQFRHRSDSTNEEIVLPFDQESQGTRAMFVLAGLVVGMLRSGAVLVVDELDRSLHPHLALKIVALFNDSQTNPKGAQLIFNTHDTNLLDTSIIRRDQIWFTEKGDDGATRLFPLTDFRARKYENIERGYLQGRYGAVPAVRTPDFRRVVGR